MVKGDLGLGTGASHECDTGEPVELFTLGPTPFHPPRLLRALSLAVSVGGGGLACELFRPKPVSIAIRLPIVCNFVRGEKAGVLVVGLAAALAPTGSVSPTPPPRIESILFGECFTG